jgi:hypothetical protein
VRGRRWSEAGPADRLLSASRCGGESLPRRRRRVPPCAPVDLNRRRQQCGLGGRSHSRASARVEGGQRQSRVGRGPAPAAGRPSPGGASRPRELLARVNTASARPRRWQPPFPPLPRSGGVRRWPPVAPLALGAGEGSRPSRLAPHLRSAPGANYRGRCVKGCASAAGSRYDLRETFFSLLSSARRLKHGFEDHCWRRSN